MTTPTRRLFVDANVLIAGAGSRTGASRAVLLLAEVGLWRLVVTRQVLDEAERKLRARLPRGLPIFAALLAALELEILPDPPETAWSRWTAVIEAKDAPLVEAAVAARVDYFLTLNTRDFTAAVAEASGLRIQTPGDFVANVREIVTGQLGD